MTEENNGLWVTLPLIAAHGLQLQLFLMVIVKITPFKISNVLFNISGKFQLLPIIIQQLSI